MLESRRQSLVKSLGEHRQALLVCMSHYQAKRLQDAIASIERALAKG